MTSFDTISLARSAGFKAYRTYWPDIFDSALNYEHHPDDIFVAAYPKSGYTWVTRLVLLILKQGSPLDSPLEYHLFSPHLELNGAELVKKMKRPGPIRTLLYPPLFKLGKGTKYIHVTRNPKDCCVSFYHYFQSFSGFNLEATFDEYFELFMSGQILYGDIFDHNLAWYSHRNDPNVLNVAFEELKENLDATILKMASFIDDKKYAEPIRKDSSILSKIKEQSSLKMVDEFGKSRYGALYQMTAEELERAEISVFWKILLAVDKKKKSEENSENSYPNKNSYGRKGIVGDWRSHFSETQNNRFNQKCAEKMKDTDILEYWKKYM